MKPYLRALTLLLLAAACRPAEPSPQPAEPPRAIRQAALQGYTLEPVGGALRAVEGAPLALRLERTPPLTAALQLSVQSPAGFTLAPPVPTLSAGASSLTFNLIAEDDDALTGLQLVDVELLVTSADPALDGEILLLSDLRRVDSAAPRLTINPSGPLELIEGAPLELLVTLETPPPASGAWILSIVHDGMLLELSPALILWDEAMGGGALTAPVELMAVEDDVQRAPRETSLIFWVTETGVEPPTFVDLPLEEVSITILDDDQADVQLTNLPPTLAEGAAASFMVALTSQPQAPVQLRWADPRLGLSPASLTFTPGNWSTPQQVQLTAVENSRVTGPQLVEVPAIITSADPFYAALEAPLALMLGDNDAAGLTAAPTSGLMLLEGASAQPFTVRLTSEPASPVQLTWTAPAGLTATPAQLTFTPANWNAPQTVMLRAPEDTAVSASNPLPFTVTGAATSADPDYQGLQVMVMGARTDNDSPGVALEGAPLRVTEGTNGTFTVRLTTTPEAPVTLQITGTPGLAVSPQQLTFAPMTAMTPQTLTVTPMDDGAYNPARAEAVTLQAIAPSPTAWRALMIPAAAVAVEESARPVVRVLPASVTEGDVLALSQASFEATLSIPASVPIIIGWETRDGSALADLDYLPASGELTFAPGSTTLPLPAFQVELVNDDRAEPEEGFTIALSSADPAILLAEPSISCTVLDDDAAPVVPDAALITPVNTPLIAQLPWSDADSDAVSFALTAPPTSGEFTWTDAAQGAFRYVPAPGFLGADALEVTATDGANTSAPARVLIEVGDVASAIQLTITTPPGGGAEGAEIEVTAALSEPPPGPVTWRWDLDGDGVFLDAVEPAITLRLPGTPTYTLAAHAFWPGGSAQGLAEIEVQNLPPILAAAPQEQAQEGAATALRVQAQDPGGDPLQLTWRFEDGAVASTEGQIYAAAWGDNGTFLVEVEATDTEGATATTQLEVTVANVPPRLFGALPVMAVTGDRYAARAWVLEPGDDALDWILAPEDSPFRVGVSCEDAPPRYCRRIASGVLDAGLEPTLLTLEVSDGDAADTVTWEVALSGADSDGGGASNLCEDAAGADPTDPADDMEDQDGDGLTLAEACALGRDPNRSGLPGAPTLLEPAPGAVVRGSVLVLRLGEASDPDGDATLTTVELYDPNGDLITTIPALIAQSGEIKIAYNINTAAWVEDATYTWSAKAADAWGEGPLAEPQPFQWSGRNDPPSVPEPVSPLEDLQRAPGALTLAVAGLVDPEGDPIQVELELIAAAGPSVRRSGPMDAIDGHAVWGAGELVAGESWLWRARALDDGGAYSAWSAPVAVASPGEVDPPDPDPTPRRSTPRGVQTELGCAATTGHHSAPSLLGAALLAVAGLLWRRR